MNKKIIALVIAGVLVGIVLTVTAVVFIQDDTFMGAPMPPDGAEKLKEAQEDNDNLAHKACVNVAKSSGGMSQSEAEKFCNND
ncbi:MAG: hypothetical protein LBS89_04100 [Zoogloeaceae bacterium]|nr:hypothetical protein [Zoogloeaceae bacterium]